MKPTILLLGGTGAMGDYLRPLLADNGFQVIVTSRSDREPEPGVRFVKGNVNDDPAFWSSSFGKPAHGAWAGLAFERVCLLHQEQIRRALGISGVANGICSWRAGPKDGRPGAQIDLVIDRDDRIVNLCEMKWCETPYEVDSGEAERLRNRREAFIRETGTRKAVHLTLVTPWGLKQNMHAGVFQSVVTFDDLFHDA